MWILIFVIMANTSSNTVNAVSTQQAEFMSEANCRQAQMAVQIQLSTFGTTVKATCVPR